MCVYICVYVCVYVCVYMYLWLYIYFAELNIEVTNGGFYTMKLETLPLSGTYVRLHFVLINNKYNNNIFIIIIIINN
jgi:hypothetical protein